MNEHFSCLDMLHVRWTSESGLQQSECGTLLEIWENGGTLHTDRLIPQGTRLGIFTADGQLEAEAGSYEADQFGYYIELRVKREWFPELYQPSCLTAAAQPISA